METTKSYKYKLQGNGKDSWEVSEINSDQIVISKYIIFEDPSKKPVPVVDVIKLLQSLSQDEIAQIKNILS